ncbi:MAG: hypothetical protein IPM13_10310 [Phycisphaerales bacterium]|nr:hypothetical protein [Phycisphaerales bacterium]
MPSFILGMDAKLYYGTAGSAANTLMGNVRNVTLNLEAGEADVTTRANSGWRATAPTLRECSVEFEMVWDPDDAGFTAIKTAFLTNGLVALKVLDKLNGQGPDGDFAITSFTRSEDLEEAITVSVTAKLSVFRAWASGGGGG